MIRLYIIGISILVIAILANGIIIKIGLRSWYDFIAMLLDKGSTTFSTLDFWDYLWLLIGYPFILSLGYLVGDKIYNILFF